MFFWAKPADSSQWEEIPASGGLLIAGVYSIAVQSPQPHFTIVSHLRQYRRREDGTEELCWQTEQPSRTNDEGVGWIVQDIDLTEGRWQISCRDADLVAELFGESPSNSVTFQVIDLKGARLSSGPQSSFSVSLPNMTTHAAIAENQQGSQPIDVSAQTVAPTPIPRDRPPQPNAVSDNPSPVPDAGNVNPGNVNPDSAGHPLAETTTDPTPVAADDVNPTDWSDKPSDRTHIRQVDSYGYDRDRSYLTENPGSSQPRAQSRDEQPPNPDDAVTEIFTPSEPPKEEFVLGRSEFTAMPGEVLNITGQAKLSGQLSVTALAQNSMLIQEVQRLTVPSGAPFISFSVQLTVPADWSEDAIVGVAELHPDDGSASLSQDFTVTAEPHVQPAEIPAWHDTSPQMGSSQANEPLQTPPSSPTEAQPVTADLPEEISAPAPLPWSPELSEEDILPPEIAFASSRTPDRTLLKLLDLIQSSAAATAARTRFQQAQSAQPQPNADIVDGIVGEVSVISNPVPPLGNSSQVDSTRFTPPHIRPNSPSGPHRPENSGIDRNATDFSSEREIQTVNDRAPVTEPVFQSETDLSPSAADPESANGRPDGDEGQQPHDVRQSVDDIPHPNSTGSISTESISTGPHSGGSNPKDLSIDIPQSLRSGDLVSVVMKSKTAPHPACVKLWVINSANQTVVDGPRWILDFSADGDIRTGITHLTVPSRVQSLQFQACAYPRLPSDSEDNADSVVPVATVTVHRAVSPR